MRSGVRSCIRGSTGLELSGAFHLNLSNFNYSLSTHEQLYILPICQSLQRRLTSARNFFSAQNLSSLSSSPSPSPSTSVAEAHNPNWYFLLRRVASGGLQRNNSPHYTYLVQSCQLGRIGLCPSFTAYLPRHGFSRPPRSGLSRSHCHYRQ